MVAIVCAILNLPLLCLLAFGAAALMERDEWAGRQSLQGVCLSLVVVVIQEVFFFGLRLLRTTYWGPARLLSMSLTAVSALIYLAALVGCVWGIIRCVKGRECDLPLFSELALRAYGKRKPRPMPGQYPPPYGSAPFPPYQQNQQNRPAPPYNQPPQPSQPPQGPAQGPDGRL